MNEYIGNWYYESDGDIGHRTHYAIRDNSSKPCGTERFEFRSKKAAQDFVYNANSLISSLESSPNPD